MRIVLMGTGPFAVPTFDQLVRDGHAIASVVVRPPVVSVSGKAPPESPVLAWAKQNSLAISTPDSINTDASVAWLRGLDADLLVVCDYGQILSREALGATRLGGINLHGSLLPRHRGAAPVQWSILSGDAHAGVSVIHMTPQLDAGPVLAQSSTPIDPREDAEELEKRLSQLGVAPSVAAIAMIAKTSEPSGITQDPALATRAPRLKKLDGLLHPGYPVAWLDRQLRGLHPWPGVYTQLILPDSKLHSKLLRVIVHEARPLSIAQEVLQQVSLGDLLHGDSLARVLDQVEGGIQGNLAAVAADGLLLISRLQPAGKKSMSSEEFLRGYSRHGNLKLDVPNQPHPLLEKMMSMPSPESPFQ
ncbi:MAG: methionyl-tRNA formyltransferase [Planctomycetota bacterium]